MQELKAALTADFVAEIAEEVSNECEGKNALEKKLVTPRTSPMKMSITMSPAMARLATQLEMDILSVDEMYNGIIEDISGMSPHKSAGKHLRTSPGSGSSRARKHLFSRDPFDIEPQERLITTGKPLSPTTPVSDLPARTSFLQFTKDDPVTPMRPSHRDKQDTDANHDKN